MGADALGSAAAAQRSAPTAPVYLKFPQRPEGTRCPRGSQTDSLASLVTNARRWVSRKTEPQVYLEMDRGLARSDMEGTLGLMPFDSPPVSTSFLDLSSGTVLRGFDPYVARHSLGSGSFGEAFLAYHPDRPNHHVVLKVPRGVDNVRATEASRRLRHEASLLRTLHHPRIVPLLDYVENPDRNFVVMSHVAGGSLAEKLRSLPGSRLPAPTVARLLLDILQALEYVHIKGVLHLDVK